MFIDAKVRGPQKLHQGTLQLVVCPLFIAFGDDDQCSSRSQHPQDFTHVVDQVRPVILGFDSGDEIECVFLEWQLRHGSLLDFDATGLDQMRVPGTRRGHTSICIIHSENLAIGRKLGQLLDGFAAAATYIQNGKVLFDLNVLQAAVGQPGMGQIHHPQEEPADPFGRFSNLI